MKVDLTLPLEGVDLHTLVDEVQKTLIQQALERTSGNCSQAAKLLGLNRPTLVEMRRRFGFPLQYTFSRRIGP